MKSTSLSTATVTAYTAHALGGCTCVCAGVTVRVCVRGPRAGRLYLVCVILFQIISAFRMLFGFASSTCVNIDIATRY